MCKREIKAEVYLSPKKNSRNIALGSVAQLGGRYPSKQKVAGLIPGQGTCLGCTFGAVGLHAKDNQLIFLSQTYVSLPLFLPPFPSLSSQ